MNSAEKANRFDSKIVNLLLVEDNPDDRKKICKLIKKTFKQVYIEEFELGLDAIEFLKNNKKNCDLIILDYELPDIDGIKVLGYMKELGLKKVAVGLTRYGEPILSDMKEACAISAFSKNDKKKFIQFMITHLEKN